MLIEVWRLAFERSFEPLLQGALNAGKVIQSEGRIFLDFEYSTDYCAVRSIIDPTRNRSFAAANCSLFSLPNASQTLFSSSFSLVILVLIYSVGNPFASNGLGFNSVLSVFSIKYVGVKSEFDIL